MKVLFVGAGRRVSLAERFIMHGFEVFSYETEKNCPISEVATVIDGKVWSDPDIKNHLEMMINDIKPDLVLPLSDKATPILSDIAYDKIITASKETNELCLNKKKFERFLFLEDYYPKLDPKYPIILKPIYGANSKGLIKNVSYDDYITNISKYERTYVAQRQIISELEISVDAYFNKQSQMIDAVPRFREEVQGGEVSRSMTLNKDGYGVVELTKQFGEKAKLIGPVCVQFIVDINENKTYIIEANARFGGGVVLSMEAGFDQIQLLIQEWINNENISYTSTWKPNIKMIRYFSDHFYQMENTNNDANDGKFKNKDISDKRFGKLVAKYIYQIHEHHGAMWYCECDCGSNSIVRLSHLTKGQATSCGCNIKLPHGEAALNAILSQYKQKAKERNLDFNLTKNQFFALTQQNCFYCGIKPQQVMRSKNGDCIYNGVDRSNNQIGYHITNVVSCCGRCNFLKLDLSQDEFKQIITKIYKHFVMKGNSSDE